MNLSTDLPYGDKAVAAYLAQEAGAPLLPMNVSKEADAAFLRELERTDPKRYARLTKNLQLAQLEASRSQAQSGTCQHCGLALPSDARSDSQYCDKACKVAAYRSRKAA